MLSVTPLDGLRKKLVFNPKGINNNDVERHQLREDIIENPSNDECNGYRIENFVFNFLL